MSEVKHTAENWTYDGKTFGPHSVHHRIFAENGDCVADVMDHGHGDADAHARLIAAAPELLDHVKRFALTLEYYIRRDENDGDDEGAALKGLTLAMVNETISKAELATLAAAGAT